MQWLTSNWGNIASVLGTLITIFFAVKAKQAAVSARSAAEAARDRVKSSDQLGQLHTCLRLMADISVRTDQQSWDVVREKAREARLAILPVANSPSTSLDSVRLSSLSDVAVALKSIADLSGKYSPGKSMPSASNRIKQMVTEHEEHLILAILDLQRKMED